MAKVRSPTVRRRELGSLLRALRTEAGLTVEAVAEQLLCSPSKVSRLETGQRGASQRDVRDLCNLYGVQDTVQRERLMLLAREGKEQAWWQAYDLTYSTYVGFEAEAATICDYALGLVPGLLQTEGYARAVVKAAMPWATAEAIEQQVKARLARQQVLKGEEPPRFEALLDEAVIRRLVGTPLVMRQQLTRILEAAELPHVTVRLIPYHVGASPAPDHKFIILRFAVPALSDIVYMEGLTGDLYLEREEDVQAYNRTFKALREMALSSDDTRDTIASVIRTYRPQAS